MPHRFWPACALALLVVSGAHAESAAAPKLDPALDPKWGVVFAGEKARELARECSRPSPGPISGTWTPTPRIIRDLEIGLPPVLARELTRYGSTAEPSTYYRQYGGLIIGGRRIVYVNGFHRQIVDNAVENVRHGGHADPTKWRRQAALICDGGAITFGVEYDPAARTFANFYFNGGLGRRR
jgi:hypothetical protein